MFAYELEHRRVAAGSLVRSMAAHPGCAATNLQSRTESVQDLVMGVANRLVAQSAEAGALRTLYAAAVTDLPGGSSIGPDGFGETRLWERSEELTGVRFGPIAARR